MVAGFAVDAMITMTDKAQRTQWAEHLRDEADAIAEQQVSAGTLHGPLEGPLPHSRNDTAAAADEAVLAERERCACVAASFAGEARLRKAFPGATAEQLQLAAALARHIAAVLRTGSDAGD